jgi:CheY-like chemotaxis protein
MPSKTKKKVVVVEDDILLCALLPSAFSLSGYELAIVNKPSEVEALVRGKTHRDADFFVCDIMMPFGSLYTKEETCDGSFTGILVARDLRSRYPSVPIIFWSGYPVKAVRAMAKHAASVIPLCALCDKWKHSEALVDAIDHFFKTGRFKRGILDRLWGALSIRPSVAGVGIDLKALR